MRDSSSNKPLLAGLHCPRCDYDLSGTSQARCPECGATFTRAELTRLKHQFPGGTLLMCLLFMGATLFMVGRVELANVAAGNPIGTFQRSVGWWVGWGPAAATNRALAAELKAFGCSLFIVAPLLLVFSVALLSFPGHWRSARYAGIAGVVIGLIVTARVCFYYLPIILG